MIEIVETHAEKTANLEQQMKTILNLLALLLITGAMSVASDKTVIRIGHFPIASQYFRAAKAVWHHICKRHPLSSGPEPGSGM